MNLPKIFLKKFYWNFNQTLRESLFKFLIIFLVKVFFFKIGLKLLVKILSKLYSKVWNLFIWIHSISLTLKLYPNPLLSQSYDNFLTQKFSTWNDKFRLLDWFTLFISIFQNISSHMTTLKKYCPKNLTFTALQSNLLVDFIT